MSRSFVTAALVGAALTSSAAVAADAPYYRQSPVHHVRSAAGDYRPLPPVSGTLRSGRNGLYGDRSYGPVRYRTAGPAVYDVRRSAFRRADVREPGYDRGVGYGGFHHHGYGYAAGAGVLPYGGYGQSSPVEADAGPANYAGQGFAPVAPSPGYGPVAYDQVSHPCGGGCGGGYAQGYNGGYAQGYNGSDTGGLGVYSAGAYGPGPRIISVPSSYNVGYATGGHAGCGCGASGLFGSFGGGGSAY